MAETPDADEHRVDVKASAHWAVIGLFILAAGAAIVEARTFLMPLILAYLLALTFSPIRRALMRRGVAPVIVATGLIAGLIALIAAAVFGLSGPLQTYATDAPSIMRDVEWKLRDLNWAFEKVAEATEEVEKLTSSPNADGTEPERVVVDQPGYVAQILTNTPYFIAQLVLTLVLLFFLISSGDMFYEKIVRVSPTFRDKRRAIGIVYDIERKISRYFLTITTINACLGVCIGFALFLLGMPNPVLFGAMAFVLNFIPFVGSIIGVIITVAIGIVSFDLAGSAVLAGAVYFALTSIEGQLITPYAVGRSLKLNPVVVFMAVAFWGWAWSVTGMVIAVPVLITLRAFSEHIPGLEGLGVFLSGRADPPMVDKDKVADEEDAETPAASSA